MGWDARVNGGGWFGLIWSWAGSEFCGSFSLTRFITHFKCFAAGSGLVLLEGLGHNWWDPGELFCWTAEPPPAFRTVRDFSLLSLPTASCPGSLGRFCYPTLPPQDTFWTRTAGKASCPAAQHCPTLCGSTLEEFLLASLPSHLLWRAIALYLLEALHVFRDTVLSSLVSPQPLTYYLWWAKKWLL